MVYSFQHGCKPLLEEADMVTYWRIWVVPREFNLVPETIVLGMGFFGFSGL